MGAISLTPPSGLAQTSSAGAVQSDFLPKNTVVATIAVGTRPYELVVSPDNSTVYVVDSGSNEVSVIDAATNTVKTTIPVGKGPEFTAITPDGKTLYVTNYNDASISVISTASNTVTSTHTIGGAELSGIAVSPKWEGGGGD